LFNPYPSTATKGFILDRIFEEVGLAGYEFDRSPEQDISALSKMDVLMAQWQAQRMNLNYNFPSSMGGGDPSDVAGVPDFAIDAIAVSVAMRVAPGMGKSMSVESRRALTESMTMIRAVTAKIPCMSLTRTTPIGMGNRYRSTVWPYAWGPSPQCESGPFTLKDLTISDQYADYGDGYIATLSGYPDGAALQLIDSVGGKYRLIGSLLYGDGLAGGIDHPVVRQTYPGATNSPYDTTLTIYVTEEPVAPGVPPTITTNASQTVPENDVLAIALTANEIVTWSLAGGDDEARFEISGTTLRWLGNGAKNYEAPDDADTDNVYEVIVRATDADALTTDKTISVTVTDVAEAPPGSFYAQYAAILEDA